VNVRHSALGRHWRRWLGSTVETDLRPRQTELDAIERTGRALAHAGTRELRARAERLRGLARRGTPEGDLRMEGFALVREAASRAIGLRPFDVQIVAGLELHRGRVVEMQTGEGKTLAAVAPAFLAALSGRGVHVLTVNDYLARRDAGWMGPVYAMLGLDVGVIQEGLDIDSRRRAYARDVTYVTAKEAGFDFLRDRLALDPDHLVHRPFHFAIVDEADSILIDEARVPLVVAGERRDQPSELVRLAEVVRQLEIGVDVDTDEHARNVNLTERGSERLEGLLGCGNLYAPENLTRLAQVRNALHAEVLLRRDIDYIVRKGRIGLVDEFTGRVAQERQWPDGLHAALEAKEGLRLRPEGRILGSMTMQHFVRSYPRLCGMTATARPAARELDEFYGLTVAVVPTNRPSIREDAPDVVFTHRDAKERALVAEIAAVHDRGRPVLVGTASVSESERLAGHLSAAGVPCRVLNARRDEEEAAIVAEAGAPGAVTISTNMAGRGTDIRLGGRDEARRGEVVRLGGLYVIGTNRHESRRIDDQLRGRAGRQGDPGSSRFFVSLDDDLFARFGLRTIVPASRWPAPGDDPIDVPFIRRELARTQRMVEGQMGDARRTLWKYSQVVEDQRRYVQDWRQEVLRGDGDPVPIASERPERCRTLTAVIGPGRLTEIVRRVTLAAIDRCWSDHLAELAQVRDGIHLVALAGQDPYEQFHARARDAFDRTLARIDEEALAIFDGLPVTADGVDWEAGGLMAPGSTWTYLVTDRPCHADPLAAMAGRPSTGLPVAALYAPFWIVWGAWRRWTSRRRRAA
jgi:preprotein translocase subunit SecA